MFLVTLPLTVALGTALSMHAHQQALADSLSHCLSRTKKGLHPAAQPLFSQAPMTGLEPVTR